MVGTSNLGSWNGHWHYVYWWIDSLPPSVSLRCHAFLRSPKGHHAGGCTLARERCGCLACLVMVRWALRASGSLGEWWKSMAKPQGKPWENPWESRKAGGVSDLDFFWHFLDLFLAWSDHHWRILGHAAWGCRFPNSDLSWTSLTSPNDSPIIAFRASLNDFNTSFDILLVLGYILQPRIS